MHREKETLPNNIRFRREVMKRRNFKNIGFNFRADIDSNEIESSTNRLSMLSEDALASVRASQVIGTLPRAIEELVRNAIEHGRATQVDVKLGTVNTQSHGRTTMFEVKDNGTGIDAKSTQTLIGTKHCSTDLHGMNDVGANESYIRDSMKGETLKSLAALSVEFHVTTTSKVREDVMKALEVNPSMTFAPTKLRKRKMSLASYRDEDQIGSKVIVCEKVIREGETVSFNSSVQTQTDSHIITTGTTIRVIGLFHNFAVRKRQYELSTHSIQDISNDRVLLSQVRNCIQWLALASPRVSLRLFSDASSSTVDCAWLNSNSTSLTTCKNDITQRIIQLCGEKATSNCSFFELNHVEDGASSRKSTGLTSLDHSKSSSHTNNTAIARSWTMKGVLCYKNASDCIPGMCAEGMSNRSRQQELVFINGKLSKRSSALGDLIHRFASTIGSSKFL